MTLDSTRTTDVPGHVTVPLGMDSLAKVEDALGGDTTIDLGEPTSEAGRPWIWRVVTYGLILGCVGAILATSSGTVIGVCAIVMMLTMLAMKMPIAIAMLVPGTVSLSSLYGFEAASVIIGQLPYQQSASWSLSVVPLFVFMGMLLATGGVVGGLFDALRVAFAKIPGSMAVGNNVAGAGLSAVTGTTMGTTYAIARISIPEMLKAGYDRRYAVSSVLMAGMSGQLIPPSIMLVIYAGLASVPIGPQLLAGFIPGVVLVIIQSIALIGIATLFPAMIGRRKGGPIDERVLSRREKVRTVVAAWPVPLVAGLIIGGMYAGWFTETEAGAVGVLAAVLFSFVAHGRGAFKQIAVAAAETAVACAAIFFLLMGAAMLTLVLADSGIADGLATWLIDANMSRVALLLVLFVVYLVLAAFMDTMAAMLLTVPILLPLFPAYGIDPIWFGVFVVLCMELGMVLPPMGVLSYVIHSLCQDPAVNLGQKISLRDVFEGVAWLMPICFLFAVLLIFFPELATWTP
jgi:C4-dicarboxylate transporter DctM subunit